MDLWDEFLILALVQGLTEFLPVSSSAHLILIPQIFGWEDQGLAFDIAVHVGTLLAVISYFRFDLMMMIQDFVRSLYGKALSPAAKVFWSIGFATIPVGVCGFFARNFIETTLRAPLVIASATMIFGIVLWVSDKLGQQSRSLKTLTWRDVVMIGCSQALSLIPGTSRSGITLTAGLWMGLTREAAARFSFLLSIPVILLAGGLEMMTLIKTPMPVNWTILGLGVLVSATSGYVCIHYFIKWLDKVGVVPFVLYRILLGLLVIFLVMYFD